MEHAAVEYVSNFQGVKATELVVATGIDPDELQKLIEAGELVEVEYILPTMDYRVKSFILPKGTRVSVRVWV